MSDLRSKQLLYAQMGARAYTGLGPCGLSPCDPGLFLGGAPPPSPMGGLRVADKLVGCSGDDFLNFDPGRFGVWDLPNQLRAELSLKLPFKLLKMFMYEGKHTFLRFLFATNWRPASAFLSEKMASLTIWTCVLSNWTLLLNIWFHFRL